MKPSPPACSRRRFLGGGLALAGLGLLSGCEGLSFPGQGPARVPRIGYLGQATPALLEAFRRGLRELGYVEGQNLVIEYRFTDGRLQQAPALAAELVGLPVDLVVATGGEPAAAAKNATSSLPIVFTLTDPVAFGLVTNIARPEGNLTGLSSIASTTVAKRLQLLQEATPGIARVAILWNPNNAAKTAEFNEARGAAPRLGLEVLSAEVRKEADFEAAFLALAAGRADSLMVFAEPLTATNSARIAGFAAEQRLPAIAEIREFTDAGGLMNYGVNRADRFHRAATYVDKILKGTKPADLPIEQPTKFDFVVNLRAAQALGLAIPQSILQQATEIIQ